MSLLLHTIASVIKDNDNDFEILKNIYYYLKKGGSIPDEIQIGQLAKAPAAQQEDESINSPVESYGDRRLQRIYLKGIRKFPPVENDYYSLELGKSDVCSSCVFLGSNGVGKTSLYSAIEWAALGRLDSAKCRGYDGKNAQIEFLKYHTCRREDAEIYLYTLNGVRYLNLADTNDSAKKFSFPAFFCMEQDIVELSGANATNGPKDSEYIAEQVGLSDYLILLVTLEKLLSRYTNFKDKYQKESSEIEMLEFQFSLFRKLSQTGLSKYLTLLNASDILSARKLLKQKQSNSTAYFKSLIRRFKYIRSVIIDLMGEEDPLAGDKILKLYSVYLGTEQFPTSDSGSGVGLENVNEDRISSLEQSLFSLYQDLASTNIQKPAHKNWNQLLKIQYCEAKCTNIASVINQKKVTLHNFEKECSIMSLEKPKIDELFRIHSELQQGYQKYIGELIKIGDTVFKRVFQQFLGNDIASVRLEMNPNGKSLNVILNAINPVNQEPIGEVNPRKYLNTFRFKLYCVSLKISLSLCCMQWYNIEFPIVIDDVFDSSDFNNRERIRTFIKNIFLAYSGLFPENHPLQMIFFTQDDVIGDSVYRGIQESLELGAVKYSRIFNFTEAEEDDWKDGVLNNKSIRILKIEDTIDYYAQNP
ncbi:MAG: hypothetical protein K2M79_07360 [Muribaculaceae bacterium]|nr:hypothetical protein [Muribaculaceae bacterium]